MKPCICCLSIFILGCLTACSSEETAENANQEAFVQIDTTVRLIQKSVEDAARIDSLRAIDAAEKAKQQAIQLETALATTLALKKAYDESVEEVENYVESVPFSAFLGKPTESGALEIIQFGDQYIRVYADYFDGEPIGGKLFFVKNRTLVAVEVIQLKERITENGARIEDESTQISYYHDDVLLQTIDLLTNEPIESNIVWNEEHLADWKLVKEQIEIL